jgi:tetratricopeptide (TPR) repeat protein
MWRGRFDEALQESERARQLDPLSLIITVDNGAILYYARQYDRAIKQVRYVQDMEPHFPRAGFIKGAYVEKGMYAEALAGLEKPPTIEGRAWYWSWMAYIYGRSGRLGEAEQVLKKILAEEKGRPMDAACLINAYIGTRNNAQALRWLEWAAMHQPNALTSLKVDPMYDPLRKEPRFQELLRRVGLAP